MQAYAGSNPALPTISLSQPIATRRLSSVKPHFGPLDRRGSGQRYVGLQLQRRDWVHSGERLGLGDVGQAGHFAPARIVMNAVVGGVASAKPRCCSWQVAQAIVPSIDRSAS